MISANDVSRWKAFLQQLELYSSIDLVGPMANGTEVLSRPTVFVDGGARFRSDHPTLPSISVGDGDSGLGLQMDILFPKEKNVSDLGGVLGLLPEKITEVHLHGFLGGRRDHELANFGEVHHYLKTSERREVKFYKGAVVKVKAYSSGQNQFSVHGLFSLFMLGEGTFTLQGDCKYPVSKPRSVTALSSLGLSNEGFGQITLRSDLPCFVFI